MDIINRQEPFALDPGHVTVDLGDHEASFFHGRLRDIHPDAEIHISVIIRRCCLNQCNIDPVESAVKQVRNL